MKIFILFALTSVSVCNDYGGSGSSGHGGGGSSDGSSGQGGSGSGSSSFQCDSEYKNDFANDARCFEHALQTVPNLMYIGQQILCRHINNKEEKTDEYYEDLQKQLTFLGGCAGCFAGGIVGLQEPVGEVGSGVGGTAGRTLEALDHLKQSLGLAEPIHDLLCHLLSPVLASECAKKLIGDDVSKVTDNVKEMLCKKEEDLDVKLTMKTLADAGCVPGDILGTDNTLANLPEGALKTLAQAVKNLVRSIKETPLIGGILQSVLCLVGNLLNGVLNGGNSDGGILNLGNILGGGNSGGSNGGILSILGRGRGR